MFRRFYPVIFLATAACASTNYGGELEPPISRMTGTPDGPLSQVWVDTESREVMMVAGPFHIQPTMMSEGEGTGHGEDGGHQKTPLLPVEWPVDGGLRGFKLGVFSGDGTPLPRSLIHHLNVLNFDRRELVYPVPTRLIAIGSETPDIKLPSSHQVVLERGDSLGWYVAWHNDTGRDIEDAYIELVLPYGELKEGRAPLTMVYLDADLKIGDRTSFDVPPGHSEKSYEFEVPVSGKLLAAGGHVHDYGIEVRLEDVESGKVLFRLKSDRDAEGMVSSVEQKIFRRFFNLFDRSIQLETNHTYRIVGVYDNPTGKTQPGMAQIGALFRPDNAADWPVNDRLNPIYQLDVSGLPPSLADHQH